MSFTRLTYLYLLFLFAIPIRCTEREDFYSSISGMEYLLALEYHLLDNLKAYVDRELAKYQQINLLLENAKSLNNSEYLSSPINVFRAIKRSVVDFKDLENFILERSNEDEYLTNLTNIEELGLSAPKIDDLLGAVSGLARLQKIYKLNTSDLAEGRILGVQYSSAMTASDSYYIGEVLSDEKKYEQAFEWLSDAWERFKSGTAEEWDSIDKVKILETYSEAAYSAGKFQIASDLTEDLLLVDPHNAVASANRMLIDVEIFVERNTPKRRLRKFNEETTLNDVYEATCSGELHRTPTEERPLRCMYVDNNVPFLKIAPFKMEQINLEPLIVYYHEVIYDNEIKQVLQAAELKIQRSKIGDFKTAVVSTIRTSKNTWLAFDKYPFLANIKQRLLDMTQLSFETAEELQVANYGIGGHYGPHFDFFPTVPPHDEWRGNRMATALFYITDVELGGGTAFPFLMFTVKPVKRSLVFWYNLHNSTDPDYRMKHAGCPVLKGSKWILNLWTRERGQEFIRPCGLQSTAYLSEEYMYID